MRFLLPTPDGLTNPGPPTVAPDGRTVVFSATDADGNRMLWARSLDAFDARPLIGSVGTDRAFWSPDSRFVAFVADGKLKKMDITGGPPQTICDAPTGSDGSWSTEGVILFDGRGSDPIWRVPATGGVATIEVPGANGQGTGWPVFLPDGKRFLYMETAPTVVQGLKLGTLGQKDGKELFKTASRVLYADPGYLIFVREQTLVAQRVDPKTLEPRGEPVPLADGLGIDSVGLAAFDVSRTGVLIYRAGELERRRLIWVDRAGKQSPAIDAPADYRDVSFSPDGSRLVFDMAQGANGGDLWIRDLVRGVNTRFTFDPAVERTPLWSPDGRRIVFTSRANGPGDLYVKDASGTREPEVLLATPDVKYASDWSRDGRYLLYTTQAPKTGFDLWALPVEGDKKPFPLVTTRFDELFATFSPNGTYIAYQSNDSGRTEVYVQEFPDARNKWQVSTDGGSQPFWRADGKELYYRSRGRIMAVPVLSGANFAIGSPQELFTATFANALVRGHYRPTPDGQRFLVLAPIAGAAIKPASVVLNWPSALRN
jgi:Tol biopolymer transport system component